jgi:hypothetical protein
MPERDTAITRAITAISFDRSLPFLGMPSYIRLRPS